MGHRQLRLAYLVHEYPVASQTFVHAELMALRERGVAVLLATHRPPARGVEFASGPPLPALHLPVDGPGTVTVLRRAGINHLHTHFADFAVRTLRPLARALSASYSFTAHAYDLFRTDTAVRPVEWRSLAGDPRFARAATVGRFHGRFIADRGVPEDRIEIVPNAVDLAPLRVLTRPPPTRLRRIVAVGRPVEKKGFPVLVRAVRRLIAAGLPLELEVIGGQGMQTGTSDHPAIRLSPMRPHREVLQALSGADLVVAPGIEAQDGDRDGIPTVLVEALAMQRPVLASSIGSTADLVWPGISGLLLPPGDVGALEAAIRRLHATPEQLARMGRAGPVLAAPHDADAVGRRLVDRVFVTAAAKGITPAAPARVA